MYKRYAYLIAALTTVLHLNAVRTREVVHHGFPTFEKAELTNLSLSEDGILAPGPTVETLAELQSALIWTATQAKDGTLYVATGNKGRVLAINPEGEIKTIFEPEEILIRAIAIGPDNAIYAGTSPKGRIYRLTPDGRPEVYFDPAETYIWDLKFDDKGSLFVATGNRGRVYRLPPEFKPGDQAELWYESVSSHFVTLAFNKKGELLVGNDPDGSVYRMKEPFEAEVLYNSDGGEIRKIHPADNGEIYFSTFKRGSGSSPTSSSSTSGSSDSSSSSSKDSNKSPSSSSSSSAKSIFYKIKASGFVEVFWRNSSEPIYAFESLGKEGWLVCTGENGRIFHVAHDGEWKLLQTLEYGGEVTTILKANDEKGGHLLFTSNPANIYRLTKAAADSGTIVSETIDVKQVAKWGRVRAFPQSDNVNFFTRSGNTPKIDGTWSEWTPLNNNGQITGSARRYLQYKASLKGTESRLARVRLFYQLNNAIPVIRRINVVPAGYNITSLKALKPIVDINKLTKGTFVDGPPSAPPPRKQLSLNPEDGLYTAGWDAYDPNGDSLLFKVQIRRMPTESWVTLGSELFDPVHTFTTKGMKDGYYQIKVTASDRSTNPPGAAQENFLLSNQFLLDNAAPSVRLSLKNPPPKSGSIIEITAEDSFSIIRDAEYVLDGSKAIALFPNDLLFDANKENFRIELQNLSPGEHSLIVNTMDDRGNQGTAQTTFQVE